MPDLELRGGRRARPQAQRGGICRLDQLIKYHKGVYAEQCRVKKVARETRRKSDNIVYWLM
eukprot:9621857-Heterocapsa_arctica.AAC.1